MQIINGDIFSIWGRGATSFSRCSLLFLPESKAYLKSHQRQSTKYSMSEVLFSQGRTRTTASLWISFWNLTGAGLATKLASYTDCRFRLI